MQSIFVQKSAMKIIYCSACHGRGRIFLIRGYGYGRNGQYKQWTSYECPHCAGTGKEPAKATE